MKSELLIASPQATSSIENEKHDITSQMMKLNMINDLAFSRIYELKINGIEFC